MPHSTVEICRDPAGPEPNMVQGRDAGENLIAATSGEYFSSSCLSSVNSLGNNLRHIAQPPPDDL
jgi:hypothetical protein